jgi:PAS domain S-box-containing protein
MSVATGILPPTTSHTVFKAAGGAVPQAPSSSRMPWWLLVIFVVFTTGLALAGRWQYQQQRAWLHDTGRRAMVSTTASRVTDLLAWQRERLAEAAALRASRQFAVLSDAALDPSAPRDAVGAWTEFLDVLLTRRDYVGAALISPDGVCRRTVRAAACAAWGTQTTAIANARQSGQVELSDPFPVGPDLHLILAIPIAGGRGAAAGRAAVVALEIDAKPGMLTLLSGRTGPTGGSQFLLLRRSSAGVKVLTGAGRPGVPASGTRLPADRPDSDAGRVAGGVEGVFDSVAASGTPSVSVIRRVGDTEWWLVGTLAEVDTPAQLASEARSLTVLVGLLVVTAAAGLLLAWQRRQAALYRELYETEARRKVLAESFGLLTRFANDIIVFADEDGRLVEVNDRAIEAYGRSREELIGTLFSMLRAPDIRPGAGDDFARLKSAGAVSYQGDHVRKDGTRFPVDLRARYYVQDGRGYAIGIIRDVSERVALERQLRDSAETYRKLFEGANDAIVLADAETGLIIDANQKAAALTGRPVEWMRGRHQTELHPPDHAAVSRENFRMRAELDRFETIETFLQHADGHRIPVEVNASRIDLLGRPAVLGIFRDQTERLQREQELFASESRRQKLESLALLAGGIAHDFNNLLTAIVGNISLARHASPPDSDSAACLSAAESASMRAKDLTQQLLTFSRGGAPIKKVVDLARLMRETAVFACRGTTVAVDLPEPSAAVVAEADEGQIAQVVNNIAINAVQAMPAGGRIRATAALVALEGDNPEHLPAGRYARLTFTDTGTGIAPDLLPRVFDPYFTTKQQGSGLGLAISHSIVARHGGAITVRSELAAGTTFEVLLPACDAPAPEAATAQPPENQWHARVLVMDDEADVRMLALRMLERLGASAKGVEDGAAAIRAFSEARAGGRPFDVVIMDLTVTGGTGGKEATAALLAIDPAARVVVSSGYSNDPIMGNFREFGFKAVLAKPYTLAEMRAVLDGILGPAAFTPGARATPPSA